MGHPTSMSINMSLINRMICTQSYLCQTPPLSPAKLRSVAGVDITPVENSIYQPASFAPSLLFIVWCDMPSLTRLIIHLTCCSDIFYSASLTVCDRLIRATKQPVHHICLFFSWGFDQAEFSKDPGQFISIFGPSPVEVTPWRSMTLPLYQFVRDYIQII